MLATKGLLFSILAIILLIQSPSLEAFAERPKQSVVGHSQDSEAKDKESKNARNDKESRDILAVQEQDIVNIQPLINISEGFAVLAEPAVKAVVNVSTTQMLEGVEGREGVRLPPMLDEFFREFFDQGERPRRVQALASGFIINSDEKSAFVVTNYHVISEAKTINVTLYDGTEVKGKLLGVDDRSDLAVLEIDLQKLPPNKKPLKALQWGDSGKLRVGDWVLAVGNPFGLGGTVTQGIVSNRARDISGRARNQVSEFVDDLIQHSAQINVGNSGGPILSLDGKVVGVNMAIYSPSGGNVGIGFAIPAALAKDTVEQILKHGRVRRGWLGLRIQHVTEDIAESFGWPKAKGVLVGTVTEGGPASKANPYPVEANDVILEFNGKVVSEQRRLTRLVGETTPGKAIPMKLWRKGKEISTTVTVGEYEPPVKRESSVKQLPEGVIKSQGLELSSLTPSIKERYGITQDSKGIVILAIDADSAATEILHLYDVIVEINQVPVSKPEDFVNAITAAKKATPDRKHILLLVTSRRGEPRFVPLRIEDEEKEAKADKASSNDQG